MEIEMEDAQIELSLDEEIAMSEARTAELLQRKNQELAAKRAADLGPVLDAIRKHGFTAAELGLSAAPATTASKKSETTSPRTVAPKYKDPDSGNTWTGRGKSPAWMVAQLAAGRNKDDLLIAPAPTDDSAAVA